MKHKRLIRTLAILGILGIVAGALLPLISAF
jgi:hypothetical protein